MNLAEAAKKVEAGLPLEDKQVFKSWQKAYNEVLLGYGYELTHWRGGKYCVQKASTSLLEDTSARYDVTAQSCTCPNFPKTRGGLCKHRLAVMVLEEMRKASL